MATPHVLVLRAPGTNCDRETAHAFERAGAKAELVHVNRLLEDGRMVGRFQILCLPGGFSYGDDVAAGRILALQLQHHLAERLSEFKQAGKLVLGICNGFQVLIKSGLLVDDDSQGRPLATLAWNDSGRFEDRWVHLSASAGQSAFLRGVESMYLPVAHAEGKFVAQDERALAALEEAGQVVLRYTSAGVTDDQQALPYPENPNGSMGNVAGIGDRSGRVLGLMPHPERHIDRVQHPRWTRGEGCQPGDGMPLFVNAVEYFA